MFLYFRLGQNNFHDGYVVFASLPLYGVLNIVFVFYALEADIRCGPAVRTPNLDPKFRAAGGILYAGMPEGS